MADTFERHSEYVKGDRLELAPWLDLWMQGVRYGTFVRDGRNPSYVLVHLETPRLKPTDKLIPRTSVRKVDIP